MRSLALSVTSVLAVAAIAVGGAGANGSAYSPGLVYGWPGVGAGNGVRFVAFGMPRSTIVAAVRTRDGRVLRSKALRGFVGVPLVAYDGTTGGLSGDGRSLALSSYGPGRPGVSGHTTFVVVDTRSLKPRLRVNLPGTWSFDAISPSGSTLYLVEHISVGADPKYRVRTFDVAERRLGAAIVDRLEEEEVMGGVPVTRASSRDGRWAYTLYAREQHEPFVHALDTARRQAFCIDLPLDYRRSKQDQLRLRLEGEGKALAVRLGRTRVAEIDTESWKVRT
jgi:hypothetical protein